MISHRVALAFILLVTLLALTAVFNVKEAFGMSPGTLTQLQTSHVPSGGFTQVWVPSDAVRMDEPLVLKDERLYKMPPLPMPYFLAGGP